MSGLVQQSIDRLAARVPDFEGRVSGAADLAALIARKDGPFQTPSAHVLPTGGTFGQAETIAGFFRQDHTRSLAVLIWVAAYEATAARAVPTLEALEASVLAALAGWRPEGVPGNLVARRSALVDLRGNLIVWQIDFNIQDQLRITT